MTAPPATTIRVFHARPSPAMRAIVARFMVVEFPDSHDDVHLPDVSPVAAFTFRGGCRLEGERWVPSAAFTGPRATLRAHAHRHGHAVLLTHFTPAGAAVVLSASLEELAGHTRPLAELLASSTDLGPLQEQLAHAAHHTERVQLLESHLARRAQGRAPDPLVSAAAEWLRQRAGGAQTGAGARISDLARHIGLSQSALQRRFRKVVGLTPKTFARIVRLRHATRLCQAGIPPGAAAQEAGYFDQAHFINEMRRATGHTPTELLGRLRHA